MEAESTETLRNDETSQEYRVQVSTKKAVVEQMNKYKEVLKMVMEGQAAVPEETKRLLLQELLTNFEAAVQDNVLVNGQTWDEAPEDEEDEAIALETLLDDTIVETSRRRRRFPKEILPHVVRSLKAERKLMGLYEQAVKPEQVTRDPEQESIMSSLSAAAPGMVKQAIQVIKSIDTLQRQADGLCQVLNMKPSQASLEIHNEVFGCGDQSDASLPEVGGATGNRQPVKRAVEEAAARDFYSEPKKKLAETDRLVEKDKPE
ncbi:kinetochore-associated protein NSL1 homolog isoform X2 [Myripristis murdjan]|uniref:NSL1 component of MIS12 kinetochore complex n=1 Tax=Myripristis murdjan TaxID=586833 RepID=A0A667YRW9_9TELE|nr:kinetochore-associated protein NSL1 homolog isoform X2 [Myripristis murdjan]